jgi:hypothetical protein
MTADINIFDIIKYPDEPTHPKDIDINDYKQNYVETHLWVECSLKQYVEEMGCNWERYCEHNDLNHLDSFGRW